MWSRQNHNQNRTLLYFNLGVIAIAVGIFSITLTWEHCNIAEKKSEGARNTIWADNPNYFIWRYNWKWVRLKQKTCLIDLLTAQNLAPSEFFEVMIMCYQLLAIIVYNANNNLAYAWEYKK